jgi:hypothetical protein
MIFFKKISFQGVNLLHNSWIRKFASLIAIMMLTLPSFLIWGLPMSGDETLSTSSETDFESQGLTADGAFDLSSDELSKDQNIETEFNEWLWRDMEGKWQDYRGWLESYWQAAEGIRQRKTSLYDQASSGLQIQKEIRGNRLRIISTIGSYSTINYVFDEDNYHALVIPNSELSTNYGYPVLPYKNLIFSYSNSQKILSVQIRHQQLEPISSLNLVPGPTPLEILSDYRAVENLYFDAEAYAETSLAPTKLVDFQIVGIGGKPALLLNLNLLQYNPSEKQGQLAVQLEIDIIFNNNISWDDITADPYDSMFGGSGNAGYVIITPASFVSSIAAFVDWKEDIGFNVSITTVESIYASYAGRDHAEQVRTFINESFHQNSTQYFLLVGDCDIVPTREVWDPYVTGGLDNGTEPSDLYFECLDGDWDANGNSLFGEMDDDVDLFPEVMVGRLPVQTPEQARSVCASIIRYESNPVPGSWIDNFLLIGPDCFGYGDGAGMLEGELNQRFLYDSFFDVYRLYPTDGSLSHSAVISRINSGVNIIDFFDHGSYSGWSNALTASEVLDLVNGNKTFLAYAMACETAAFDAEAVEPTIGEAFFRNPNGGAVAYIGATRIAWAGYYAFDGLHNRFWMNFLQTALGERMASPKLALQSALYEMTTTFSMSNPISLETVYQAIYFGDPAMNLYWKHNVTNTASPVEVNEVIQLNGTCTMLHNDTPIIDTVNVIIRDPIGRKIYENNPTTDSFGKYTVSFSINELPGHYTVETTITQPFTYTAVNEFYVGNLTVTTNLDSQAIYFSDLLFSGTTSKDGTGNASIVDAQSNILESKQFSITGGTYTNSLNVTGFGWLKLYIQLTSGSEHGAAYILFQVIRGDVLIISDDTGSWGPEYPGGWVDYNYGDSTNYADYYIALKEEYNVTTYLPRYNCTPSLAYLKSFDAVIVTVGDNFGYPLISPDSFLLDVLLDYHNDGGNLLIEGCRIFSTLRFSPYNESFTTLSHTRYLSNVTNTGSLTLENLAHEITTGLPSTITLAGGLGSRFADVCEPFNGSEQVSRYYGIYPGASAIAALAPSSTFGGVVYISFSIDAISDQNNRSLLIRNSVEFLLQPRLQATLSDDAIKTGTSETIIIDVFDAATEQPITGANVTFNGCGVTASNYTTSYGNCSIFIAPTSEGTIQVEITKYGFINYTSGILVYDKPIIAVDTIPDYLQKQSSQSLTVIATDYYERFSLDNCFINVTGLGVADAGFTNTSGMVDFIVSPTSAGLIQIHANLTGYINITSTIPVRIQAIVLPSGGTIYPEDFCWDELNLNWQDFGSIPIQIDYTTLASISNFTLQDLIDSNADVLIMPYLFEAFSETEIVAITTYIRQGHGLLASGFSLYYHTETLSPLFGLVDYITWSQNWVGSFEIITPSHPVVENLPDPFSTYYGLSFFPEGTGWDSSVLAGATYLALDASVANVSSFRYGSVLAYRGIVYTSHFPELLSNNDDMQLVYNALTWSSYNIPEHELRVTLETPTYMEPGDTVLVNATIFNEGLNNETNLELKLYINGTEVDALSILELANFTSKILTYHWTPTLEGIYNVTAYVAPVAGENVTINNVATSYVDVRPIKGWILWDLYHANDYPTSYSLWLSELYIQGYIIEELSTGPITLGTLSQYDILICAQPYLSYSSTELTIIENFVLAGGGLLVIGDDSPSIFTALTDFSGIDWTSGGYGHLCTDITTHDVTNNVFSTYFAAPMSELLVSGDAISLIRDIYGNHMLAASELTNGRVLAIADEQTITNSYIGNEDNFQLAINMIDWLLNVKYPHELTVFLEAPSYNTPGTQAILNMTVRNRGTNNETNVVLQLFINETLEFTQIIASLDTGDNTVVSTPWTPTIVGLYNITAYVVPVPTENVTSNNRDMSWVIVRIITGRILYDWTHGNDLIANFSMLFSTLEDTGVIIDVKESGTISSSILEGYSGLICAGPTLAYSASELIAIENFVLNGGGLLVTGQYRPDVTSTLTGFAGIYWLDYWNYSASVTDITTHEITQNINSIYVDYINCYLQTSSPAVDLARLSDGKIILAASEQTGRIVSLATGYSLYDYYINLEDNFDLGLNIISWILGSNEPPSAPILLDPGDLSIVREFMVTWEVSTDPEGATVTYNLQMASDSSFQDIIQIWAITATEQIVTVPEDGVYFFRVCAQDNLAATSEWSNVEDIIVNTILFLVYLPLIVGAIIVAVAIPIVIFFIRRTRISRKELDAT